jgi:hypothetical protein
MAKKSRLYARKLQKNKNLPDITGRFLKNMQETRLRSVIFLL